jgi:hypothetical protein
MGEIQVPAFYVVSRKLKKEHAGPILRALSITPVVAAVISDVLDADLALSFSPQVFRRPTEADSCEFAMRLSVDNQIPVLVVGTADVLDAIYVDGTRAKVACDA